MAGFRVVLGLGLGCYQGQGWGQGVITVRVGALLGLGCN
jgi:hypothetical protein